MKRFLYIVAMIPGALALLMFSNAEAIHDGPRLFLVGFGLACVLLSMTIMALALLRNSRPFITAGLLFFSASIAVYAVGWFNV